MLASSTPPRGPKRLFIFFVGVMLPISLVVIIFLTVPKIRHGTFLLAQRLPGGVTHFFLTLYVPHRHFEKTLPWLDFQLKLTNKFSSSQNTLLPDLIKNTNYVFQRVRFPDQLKVFVPFLERLVESFPEIFLGRVWLAKALARSDPIIAFKHLEEAVKLSSVDDRPYRIALSIALRENLSEQFQGWCDRFQKAQFGGHHFLDYNTLFGGLGMRAMALEIIDNKGVRELVGNTGIQLGKDENYNFPLKGPVKIHSMSLHFGVVPGVLVRMNQVQFFKGGRLIFTLGKDMSLMSWGGYHLKNGDIFLASQDAEIINFYPPIDKLGLVDSIRINLRFARPGLGTPFPCSKNALN